MKIGILTFHRAINYGAVLQAYGLQETLKSMGHEVSVIDYCPEYLLSPYRLFFTERITGHGFWGNLRMIVRECLAYPYRWKRNHHFQKFIDKYINIHAFHSGEFDNDFDILIIGSDQVWNIGITRGMDPFYWGTAKQVKSIKHISYAASAGSINSLKKLHTIEISAALEGFSSLSVRELTLANYIQNITDITPRLVLDPVLLAGRKHFERLISYKRNKPYLLFFTLNGNKDAQKIAKRIAEEKNLVFREMASNNEVIKDLTVIKSASPEEFLSWFENADYVVTTSFHGTAFSILFHKNFHVYCDNENISERISNLLNMLNLYERMICTPNHLKEYKYAPINWTEVDAILETKRKESMDFLKNALEK